MILYYDKQEGDNIYNMRVYSSYLYHKNCGSGSGVIVTEGSDAPVPTGRLHTARLQATCQGKDSLELHSFNHTTFPALVRALKLQRTSCLIPNIFTTVCDYGTKDFSFLYRSFRLFSVTWSFLCRWLDGPFFLFFFVSVIDARVIT